MQYKLDITSKHAQEFRKTQSASKSRGRESPMYRNLTHKNASQPRVVNLFRSLSFKLTADTPVKSNQYLQTSIDVHEINRPQKPMLVQQRIKTEIDNHIDLNRRFYPNEMQQLLNKIEAQKQKQIVMNRFSIVRYNGFKQQPRVQQRRETYDGTNSKQQSQPELSEYPLNRPARKNCMVTPDINNSDENQQFNYFISRIQKRRNIPRSDDTSPLRRSLFQQIQDFSDTHIQQMNLSKEEEALQFSFGFQYNKSRVKRFPKDIFCGDVRKARKNFSLMQ